MIKAVLLKIKKHIRNYNNKRRLECIENIFDYNKVIEKRPYWEDTIVTNNYYGTSYCLKRYSNYKGKIKCAIEHGMPHTLENTSEFKENNAKVLLVSSEERKKTLLGHTDKTIIPYGPLIAYSEPIYDETAMRDIKDNLGKTMVVYPMHSIEDYHFKNSTDEFIKYVETIKEKYNFDTVLVSVYFIDIQRGLHIKYLQKGWQIVSAGNRKNYDFMDCQRTIMEIADLVVCQGYSSALGYAGYLKKPILYKDLKLIAYHNNESLEQDMWVNYKEELLSLFSEYRETQSDEQYNFLDKLYGYSSVKTKDELYNIFDKA